MLWTRVGVIGATIVRGERGGEAGGVDGVVVMGIEGIEAERGLQESLRRQLFEVMLVYAYMYRNNRWSGLSTYPSLQ